MSIDKCTQCDRQVDTDFDEMYYYDDGARLCDTCDEKRCREKQEELEKNATSPHGITVVPWDYWMIPK